MNLTIGILIAAVAIVALIIISRRNKRSPVDEPLQPPTITPLSDTGRKGATPSDNRVPRK